LILGKSEKFLGTKFINGTWTSITINFIRWRLDEVLNLLNDFNSLYVIVGEALKVDTEVQPLVISEVMMVSLKVTLIGCAKVLLAICTLLGGYTSAWDIFDKGEKADEEVCITNDNVIKDILLGMKEVLNLNMIVFLKIKLLTLTYLVNNRNIHTW
jgi:hypothetical protein